MKRPGLMLYPKEWRGDLELKQCSLAAQGLWIRLICLMHEGEPYGHLSFPIELVLDEIPIKKREFELLMAELETDRLTGKRVAYRTGDGVIYSKRMVKDEIDRATRAANGKFGGRPSKSKATFQDRAVESAWQEFCNLYPKHRFDEQMACQMFISRADDSGILAGLKRALASDDWAKDAGKFVPWASKFVADGKYTGFKASAPAATPYVPYKPPT